jgi:hypothetical protein
MDHTGNPKENAQDHVDDGRRNILAFEKNRQWRQQYGEDDK